VAMVARVIPLAAWRAAADPNAPMPVTGRVALGFDCALDRSDASIAAAWRDEGGTAHLELADHRPGVAWVPERMAELGAKWDPVAIAYDAAGPALDIADVMTRAGTEVDALKAREYAAACAGLLGAITDEAVRIRPHKALDDAATVAARRTVGDGLWGWGRRQSATSISALTAATAALWAWDHAPAATGPFRIY
jgi:hypothetical protein